MSNNLDFLKTAVFIDKESQKEIASTEFNKTMIDPYKSFIINAAGRLKVDDEDNRLKYYTNKPTKSEEALCAAIRSYIISNTKDLLMSIGASFSDKLSNQFVYEFALEEEHNEFELPFAMITKSDKDIVEEAYNHVFNKSISYISPLIGELTKKPRDPEDLYVQRKVSVLFDAFYSHLYTSFFESLILKIASYYLNRSSIDKSSIVKDFYTSFLEKSFSPYNDNKFNNNYNYIVIVLRELMAPLLDKFKDGLYVMSNTVTSMILGYNMVNIDETMTYDEYISTNPFAYEILLEKYSKLEEEKSDEEVIEDE